MPERTVVITFMLQKDAVAPHKAYRNDAGFDLFAPLSFLDRKAIVIQPHATAIIDTKVVACLPDGWFGKIEMRSSLAARGLCILGGVIDSDYTGTLKIILHNLTDEIKTINVSDAIAQLVLYPLFDRDVQIVEYDENHSLIYWKKKGRGENGFGSTNEKRHSDGL